MCAIFCIPTELWSQALTVVIVDQSQASLLTLLLLLSLSHMSAGLQLSVSCNPSHTLRLESSSEKVIQQREQSRLSNTSKMSCGYYVFTLKMVLISHICSSRLYTKHFPFCCSWTPDNITVKRSPHSELK